MRWAGLWENIALLNYLGMGVLTWSVYGFLTFNGRRKMLLLEKPRPTPNPPPPVTILIPAKDEQLRIQSCLQSALDQDYPNFHVIAIDDRSVDRTGAIMDEIAARDARLTVIHIQPGSLAPGWTGKNNALYQGVLQSTGEWLLFVDSDVILQPVALSKSLTTARFKKYDLLSLLPRLESHSFSESSLIPLCSAAAGMMYLISLTNDDSSKSEAFANGQFMLFSRAAYDAVGGHETVKDRFCEDTEIARIMKERGMRTRISWGEDLAAVRMYSSFNAIIKGWSRIYYAAKVGNPKQLIAAIWFILSSCFTAYIGIIYGINRAAHPIGNMLDYVWLAAGLLHLGLMTFFIGCIYRWSKNAFWNALLFPFTGLVLLWILFKALIMCITKKVEWRGTSYAHTMTQNLAVKP